jgi:hypothetical protein
VLGFITMAAAIAAALYARQAAAAADQSNQTSREAYIADQRPWLAAAIEIAGPLQWNRSTFSLKLRVKLENTGKTPALTSYIYVRVFAHPCGRNLHDEQMALAEWVGKTVNGKIGLDIFPGQTRVWRKSTYGPEPDEMDRAQRWQRQQFGDDDGEFLPVLIGSALYYSSVDERPRHTSVICHVSRKPDGGTYRTISRTEGDIPADQLEVVWSSVRGLTD